MIGGCCRSGIAGRSIDPRTDIPAAVAAVVAMLCGATLQWLADPHGTGLDAAARRSPRSSPAATPAIPAGNAHGDNTIDRDHAGAPCATAAAAERRVLRTAASGQEAMPAQIGSGADGQELDASRKVR
jgi:hypothetical protein